MTADEVIERLCKLVTKVGEQEFNHKHMHDCFCGENATFPFEGVDEEVIAFIEKAVEYRWGR